MTRWTIIRRNLLRRKLRLFLMVAAVAIAFLILGVMTAVRQNFSSDATQESESRLIVINRIGFSEPLPIRYVDTVNHIPGVLRTSYRSMTASYYRDRKNLFLLMAVDPASYFDMYPEYVVPAPTRSAFLADRSGMLVGDTLAGRFGWRTGMIVPIKQRVSLRSDITLTRMMRISGIFRSSSAQSGTGLALFHYAALNDDRATDRDTVGAILVKTGSSSSSEKVRMAIDGLFKNSAAETATMTEEAFGRALAAQIGNISFVTVIVSCAGFVAILLIVGSAFSAAVRERRREIGALRLLGFLPRDIMALVLTESLMISFIGGLIGISIAHYAIGGIRAIDSGTFGRMAILPSDVAISFLLMLAFGLCAAFVPAFHAHRTSVSEALSRR